MFIKVFDLNLIDNNISLNLNLRKYIQKGESYDIIEMYVV